MTDPTKVKQLQEWHQLFKTLTELTSDTESFFEVAQRMIEKGMVMSENPCDSIWELANSADDFFSELGEAIWDPDKDPYMKNAKDKEKGRH
jgi:hypothetical protein